MKRISWVLSGLLVLAAVVFVVAPAMQSSHADNFAQDRAPSTGQPDPARPAAFAEGRAPVPFDGARALDHLKAICDIGPRISGSDGLKKQQDLIEAHFKALGATVTYQRFEAKQRSQDGKVAMANMVISFDPAAKRRVLICGHYDTRPIADQERDPKSWRRPFVSANDGASTAAWMMELGRHVKGLELKVGLDFVLFDGEEYVFGRDDDYFFGSRHFARDYKESKPAHQYIAGVLLDLFAGEDARLPAEPHSSAFARGLVQEIWDEAQRQGYKAFERRVGREVEDDHIALNRIAGIPTIDIIDFDYPHWHKLSDTPDKVSPATLTMVANVLVGWLKRVE